MSEPTVDEVLAEIRRQGAACGDPDLGFDLGVAHETVKRVRDELRQENSTEENR